MRYINFNNIIRDVNPSSSLLKLLRSAADIQKKNGDSHMAVDHLILASVDDRDISNVYKEAGVDKGRLEAAVKEVLLFSVLFMKIFFFSSNRGLFRFVATRKSIVNTQKRHMKLFPNTDKTWSPSQKKESSIL